jgi:phosphatidylglycerol lysyltransferase
VGAEAVVDLEEFTLEGGQRENLRQMCHRARRNGVQVEEISPKESAQALRELHGRWVASRPRGYRMALLVGDPGLGCEDGRRFFAARERDGSFQSFVTVHPIASGGGAAVDALIRHEDASPGAADLLIVETLGALSRDGVQWLSLGACPLVETTDPGPDDPSTLRYFLRRVSSSTLGDALFSFQGLYQFKAKFKPRWEPIHLGGLPSVGFWAMYAGGRMWGLTGKPCLQKSSEA